MKRYTHFRDIPKLNKTPAYACDVYWGDLVNWINHQGRRLDLDPDFQRGHVWTQEQKVAFVEFCLQGGVSGRNLFWNCPGYSRGLNNPLELVDGKQRLSAVMDYIYDEFPAFGGTFWRDIARTGSFADHSVSFRMNILGMTRRETLEWYIFMNAGGTPHARVDIERARELLAKEVEDGRD